VVSLIDMIQDKQMVSDALHDAIYQQDLELHHKRSVVQSSIRCPLSHEVQSAIVAMPSLKLASVVADSISCKQIMENPVFAADGYTYERRNIEEWLKSTNESPITKESLPHQNLVPNHQLHGQIEVASDLCRMLSQIAPRFVRR
jgi:hypothetical protein